MKRKRRLEIQEWQRSIIRSLDKGERFRLPWGRLRPASEWVQLPGPRGHGMSPVFQHPSGARLHVGGLLRMPDGKTFKGPDHTDQWDLMCLASKMQPRRLRALLVWAELVLSKSNDEHIHH